MMPKQLIFCFKCFVLFGLLVKVKCEETVQPCDSEIYCYGDLLEAVQLQAVFNGSKTFVDMPMKASPETILSAFGNLTSRSRGTLSKFVNVWFNEPGSDLIIWEPPDWQDRPNFIATITNKEFREWAYGLNNLWRKFGKKLKPEVQQYPSRHSLLSVSYPFISAGAGGRFIEFYYWDSYWIIKGLLLCGMNNTARGMISNMAELIDKYGFVPNGGRIYYTKRTQPPLLTWMVSMYYELTNDNSFLTEMLPSLDKEYQFWMTNRSVVIAQCNCSANHYATPITTPRPESYREDNMTASQVPAENRSQLFSNIASAAESGWDFSSRWFSTTGPFANTLASNRAKSVIPVDLNAILGINEQLLEKMHRIAGSSPDILEKYANAWIRRQTLFENLFWSENDKSYRDWLLDEGTYLSGFYASSLTPFYMYSINNSLNVTRSKIVLGQLRSLGILQYPGGIPTSLNDSTQQWDFPNAWAPLQWFLVKGWENADDPELRQAARDVAVTWLRSTYAGWVRYNNSMFEKYNCTESGNPGGGGEYIIQSGFGWTNGVCLDFLNSYPDASPTSSPSSSSHFYFLWFLLIIPIVFICLLITCVFCCRRIYTSGKNKYWARIRNEHLLHSSLSSNSSDAQSPTFYENPNAIDTANGNLTDTTFRRIDV